MKKQRVFSLKVANGLLKKGHKVVDVEINIKNPLLKVFVFEKTEKFEQDLAVVQGR